MEADVRIVRLTRKIIRDQKDVEIVDGSGSGDYFATDYFDIMKVEKKELSSSLTSIMGIWPDEKMDILDVAAQSYSLYCSTEMMELEKGRKECGDPFLSENKDMPFLSVVQVHITPEVIAHALAEKTAKEVVHAVYKDLHTAMDGFVEVYKSDVCIFRIYKMLSAGDFAIVLRSKEAGTSFKVSSLLRRRIMAGSGEKKIVLYKTYTLLTFGDDVIKQEVERPNLVNMPQGKEAGRGRFVLRCCYSNLYWSNKEKVDEFLKRENILSLSSIQLYGLNGRYDFSIRITEGQFLELLSDIRAYKEAGMKPSEDETGQGAHTDANAASEDSVTKYMRYLMKNHYLSYINERYLVAQEERNEASDALCRNGTGTKICIKPMESREEFLDYKINEKYKSVAEKCGNVKDKVAKIRDYRKNMMHYMDLLDKLIKLCYGINGFSDTRIYAAVLLEQLDVIMDSVGLYVEMYQNAEEEKEDILNLLEEYIRESVCALDGYAQYIRNNNLQSLQTPNYNIESNMSMEKLLIGYSEFLRVFTEFYQRREADINSGGGKCEYLPVVVPALSKRDVSVEVLFEKGVMNDWDKESDLRKALNHGKERYCMVISVPTLAELGSVRTMVTSLFHEAAHQFRYESRQERNDALLKYIVRMVIRDMVNGLVSKFQNDTGLRDWDLNCGRIMEDAFVEAYMEANYGIDKGVLKYPFQKDPLINFEYCLKRDLYDTFGFWEEKSDIRSVFRAFLKEIMRYYRLDNSQCSDTIQILYGLIVEMEDGDNKEEQIVKGAYVLSWECAYQNINNDSIIDCPWEHMGFREWISDENDFYYKKNWDKTFGEAKPDGKSKLDKIWKNFLRFSGWIYEHCGENENARIYNRKKKTEFLNKVYQKMCAQWNGEKIQKVLNDDIDGVLSSMGRAFGIDCNTNENHKIFEEQVSSVIIQKFDLIIKMAEWRIAKYREETADMLMCGAMKLTPFGYMHMLAAGWPDNQELSREHYVRIQNVFLFQWCLDEKGNLSADKFGEVCAELIRELEKAVGQAVQMLIDKGEKADRWQYTDVPLVWDGEDERNVIRIWDRMESLADYCGYIDRKIRMRDDPFIKRICEALKFYGIMANMIEQLLDRYTEPSDYLNDFDELRDDYIRGVGRLKNLNDEMCNDKDTLVRQLGEFCKELSVFQNEPYLLIERVEKNEEMNVKCIEFLLDMYYANKRRMAQQIGGEEWH